MAVTPPVARYRQIAETLRTAIKNGEYPPGSALPSEPELAEQFGVGRPTVHDAIGILRTEGLVYVEHGRGTFVAEFEPIARLARSRFGRAHREEGDARGGFDYEIRALGKTPRVELDQVGQVTPPAEVADRLGLRESERALIRARRYYADDKPVQLATSYLPWSIADGTPMTQPDPGVGGIYSRLADAGHAPVRFTEDIQARMPTDDEAAFLQIGAGQPVFHLIRTAYDTNGRAVEICDTVMAASRWKLTYDWTTDE